MIKLRDILLEMGSMTIKPVLDLYDQNPDRVSNALFPGKKTKSKDEVENELKGFDYNEFSQFRDELGVEIEEAEKTPEGRPLNKAYLTKNKSAMKSDIDKAAKLSDKDPAAYGKWDADYSDKAKTKPYPTKKSTSTTAYEKRFGKSENVVNEVHTSFVSGNSGRTVTHLDNKKYQLTKDVKGAQIGNYHSVVLPKGSIIHNLPGGVFVYHPSLKDKFSGIKETPKLGFRVTTNPDTLITIEKSSKILELVNEGNEDKALSNKAKATGISKTVLRGVYDKGLAAWKTGHRPGVGQHQWAMARVNSFVTGKGGARKADKGLWKKASKSKKKKSNLKELDLKKILGTAALAAGLAGSPNMAKAQEPNKAPTTQVQKQDTAQTATATYAHPNENTARNIATTKARAALATKLGKSEGSISTSTVDTKMYKLADGRYECTSTVKIN